MSADLIQRLQRLADSLDARGSVVDARELQDAVNALERMDADALAALTRERDRLQGIARDAAEAATEHQREVLRLRAELDALRRMGAPAMREGCNYVCPAGRICNKCGHMHGAAPTPAADAEALRDALRELIEANDEQDAWRMSHPALRASLDADYAHTVGKRVDDAWAAARAALAADAGRAKTEGGE